MTTQYACKSKLIHHQTVTIADLLIESSRVSVNSFLIVFKHTGLPTFFTAVIVLVWSVIVGGFSGHYIVTDLHCNCLFKLLILWCLNSNFVFLPKEKT